MTENAAAATADPDAVDRTATDPGASRPDATAPGGTGSPSLRDQAEAALRALVGREDARLREDQWTAVEALVAHRRRALVVERTGWGKSAVYFVATSLLRAGARRR